MSASLLVLLLSIWLILVGKAPNNMEFEARSARDGAWYDVAAFLSVRNKDTDDPEVLVRFVGLTPEEDEWIKVSKHVRHRSLPCEASECVAVLPGDLILCFQEAPEQALYFDAHVLDAQRMKHDSRGCRCSFMVRYDHDQFEEVVPLRKICRRPETDYRLQIYQALPDLPAQQKKIVQSSACSAPLEDNPVAESVQMPAQKVDDNTAPASSAPSSPVAREKNTAGSLEEGNPGHVTADNASKLTRKAEESVDQDAETKRPRPSDHTENPVGQDASTPAVMPESDKQDETQGVADSAVEQKGSSPRQQDPAGPCAVVKEKEAVSNDVAEVDDGDPNPGGGALTCQNQTNGHTGGSGGGSSDVAVGVQQCF
uniref:SAWADEE domain-containing protein n=1 Tax=Kalanchoe fedtschenkoi TaxID=63787 RepID=A0A7N0V4D3_KALFE